MSQVTIYVERDLAVRMKAAAAAQNMSQSKWIANLIRERLENEWPATVVEMAGTWTDFPDLLEIRSSTEDDLEREPL